MSFKPSHGVSDGTRMTEEELKAYCDKIQKLAIDAPMSKLAAAMLRTTAMAIGYARAHDESGMAQSRTMTPLEWLERMEHVLSVKADDKTT